MDKTSKAGQLRALREARHTEQGRPAPEPKKPARTELQRQVDALIAPTVPTPDLRPAKPARNVATKNKKRVAQVIGEERAAIRTGKRQLNVSLDQDLVMRMKHRVLMDNVTIEEWVSNAIEQKLGLK